MATVASLLVKLGLDSKRFDKGAKKAVRGLDQLVGRLDKLNKLGKFTAITAGASAFTSLAAAAGPASGAVLALPAAALVASAGVATLAAGLSGVGEAMVATGGTSEELQKALDKLAPSAQKFVRSFAGIREQFKPIQQAVQQKLFAGLGKELSELAQGILPTARRGMTAVASALNGLGKEALATMKTPLFKGQMADIFDGTAKATRSFSGVVGPLLTVLAQLAIVGLPLITRFNEWAAGALKSAAAFLTSEQGAARMTGIVQRAGDVLAQLGEIAGNLGSLLAGIFGAASVDGASLLDTVTQLTAQWATWANSAQGQEQLGQIFTTLNQIFTDLLAILPGVASVIGTIASAFTSLPGPVQSTITQMLAWSMVLGAVSGKIMPLYGGIKMLSGGLLKLGKAATAGGRLKTIASAFGRVGAAAGRAAAQVAAATAKMIASMAKAAAKMVVSAARYVAAWVLMGVQAMIQAARMALAWIIGLGPIAWIIAAVIALVALIILYWDEIVAAISAAWQWVKQVTVAAWQGIVNAVTAAWEWIKSAISAAVQFVLNWLKSNWMLLLGIILGPVGLAVGLIIKHWDKIKAATAAAWQWVKAKIGALISGAVNLVKRYLSVAKAAISGAWNAAKSLTSRAWNAIKNAVSNGVGRMMSLVTSIPGKVKSALSNAKNFLLSAGRRIIQGLIDGVTGMIGKLKAKFSSITGMIPDWKGPMSVDMRLLEPSGAALMAGLGRGVEKALPGLRSTLQGVTREIPRNVTGSVRHTGGAETRVVIDVTGADEEFKRMFRKLLRTTPGLAAEIRG
ncbi:phage tail protein [Streptomonospora wellingtoniae]|uniref:Tape measure protein n=1 Tax=Streptomonospora wellingtoniae TaxID=3075544 RepID=A0ABU2L0H7_9ACTN|nr:hypothetical protein [Streptomonospora sp. DSM 45055]MDT0305059.1 hypothetical protein [Streptomonospora sp. DSM 45055]